MSFPFRANASLDTFGRLVETLRSVFESCPDERTGNITYSMADAGLGAFSVFFTQTPSFLMFHSAPYRWPRGAATPWRSSAYRKFGILHFSVRFTLPSCVHAVLDPGPRCAVSRVHSDYDADVPEL